MKKILMTFLTVSLTAMNLFAAENFKGPFKAESLGFYFVHSGGPLAVTAELLPDGKFPKALATFYDAAEKQTAWKYEKMEPGKPVSVRHDYGKNAPKGIYQLRVSGDNVLFNVKAEPNTSFGVMPMRCRLSVTSPDQFAETYIQVPVSGTEKITLSHRFGNYELFSPNGETLLKNKEYNGSNETLEAKAWKGKVLKLSLRTRAKAPFDFISTGIPLILCPDAKTAQAIGGSLVSGSNGSYFAFPFQAGIQKYIATFKKNDLEVKIVPPSAMKKEWEKEPHAVAALDGLFKHLNAIIQNQNIDPASPDFGKTPNYVALAIAASLDKPFNPYYKNPAMIKRALLGIYKHYLQLNENGTLNDINTNYSGIDCFEAHKLAQATFFLSPIVSGQEKEFLFEGIRRIADRFPFYHVSCENQSTHWLMVYQHLAMANIPGTDFLALARDYAASFSDTAQNRFMITGYLQERYGPDATYQGLAGCMLSVYYRYTKDPGTKELLRKIYNFFNHSVAPEPDGTVYGSSGFSHRTFGTWVQRQWNAGTPMMAGELPEAAVWYRRTKKGSLAKSLQEPRKEHYEKLPQWLTYPAEMHMPLYSGYFFPAEPLKNALFPAEKGSSFTENFNNEFLAVKRSGYYAFVYTGMTSAKWVRASACRKPGDRDHRSSWNPIQGLQLVWSKEYGNLFTTTSWNSYTYAMTAAEMEDGKISFPDYWTFKRKFDANTMTLTLTNIMFDLPAEVTRTISFTEKGILQKISIVNSGAWKCRSFYEQLPLLAKKGMKLEYLVGGKWQSEPGEVTAVRITNTAGAGFEIQLKTPCKVAFGTTQEKRDQKLLPLRFILGNSFEKNQNIEFEYLIKTILK